MEKVWNFANDFHHVGVFSFLSFTTEYSVIRGDLLPFSKVKKQHSLIQMVCWLSLLFTLGLPSPGRGGDLLLL